MPSNVSYRTPPHPPWSHGNLTKYMHACMRACSSRFLVVLTDVINPFQGGTTPLYRKQCPINILNNKLYFPHHRLLGNHVRSNTFSFSHMALGFLKHMDILKHICIDNRYRDAYRCIETLIQINKNRHRHVLTIIKSFRMP